MKIKHFIIPALLLLFILYSISSPAFASLKNKQEGQESDIIIIPEKVKSIFQEGIETREARLDIPFSIIWHVYLPAQQNMHCIFYFKVKNTDLGFSPITPAAEIPEKKEEKEKEETPELEPEIVPTILQASGHVFLQFNRLENNTPKEVVKEVYIPINLEADSTSYQPDKEELYSTAYPLPSGNYLLSMALASLDMEKIGTQYFEFSLPDSLSYTEELGTTPIFLAREIKRISSPETTAEVHKEFFSYSVLQITPNMENFFSVGDNLDIFFFVFGAKEMEKKAFDLELINWNWSVTASGSYVEGKGQVKNISNRSLRNVEAVVSFNDKEGTYITHSSALIDFNPILAGQTSPFKVIETYNPAIRSASIQFKFLDGETIPIYQKRFDIEITYEVFKGEERVIHYATAHYDAPIISQPLPMKKTVVIKSEEGEKKEQRDLEPGNYTLQISIEDKVSGNSVKKSIDFDVK